VRQSILERYPDAELAVYTVWLPMLATDARSEWEAAALPDGRVRHYWDEERTIGRWLAEKDVGGEGAAAIVWDAAFAFGPDATWDDVPGPVLASGAPIVDAAGRVERALRPALQ
jgi:hypothetical protein